MRKICVIESVFKWLLVVLAGLAIYLCGSCSQLKKLERLERKNPHLFNQVIDTIEFIDSVKIVVPGTKLDTVVPLEKLRDTIRIKKDHLSLALWQEGDSLHVQSNVDDVTVTAVKKYKVPYSKREYAPKPRDKLRVIPSVYLFFLLVFVVYQLTKGRSN